MSRGSFKPRLIVIPFAGLPFIVINTLCGALAAYGFAGLRYTPSAIILYSIILVLQSLIAIQVMVFCVYVSSNQVSTCQDSTTLSYGKKKDALMKSGA